MRYQVALASITITVMILLFGCAPNQKPSTVHQSVHTEKDEFMTVEEEMSAFSDFFFEHRAAFERIVSGLSAYNPPNEKLIYCQFDKENGLYWSDGFEIEPIVDSPLQGDCDNLLEAGYHFDSISYKENTISGKQYAFGKRVCDSTGWPLCYIAILHFDTVDADPSDYDELEQLENGWWISMVYYDAPYVDSAE